LDVLRLYIIGDPELRIRGAIVSFTIWYGMDTTFGNSESLKSLKKSDLGLITWPAIFSASSSQPSLTICTFFGALLPVLLLLLLLLLLVVLSIKTSFCLRLSKVHATTSSMFALSTSGLMTPPASVFTSWHCHSHARQSVSTTMTRYRPEITVSQLPGLSRNDGFTPPWAVEKWRFHTSLSCHGMMVLHLPGLSRNDGFTPAWAVEKWRFHTSLRCHGMMVLHLPGLSRNSGFTPPWAVMEWWFYTSLGCHGMMVLHLPRLSRNDGFTPPWAATEWWFYTSLGCHGMTVSHLPGLPRNDGFTPPWAVMEWWFYTSLGCHGMMVSHLPGLSRNDGFTTPWAVMEWCFYTSLGCHKMCFVSLMRNARRSPRDKVSGLLDTPHPPITFRHTTDQRKSALLDTVHDTVCLSVCLSVLRVSLSLPLCVSLVYGEHKWYYHFTFLPWNLESALPNIIYRMVR